MKENIRVMISEQEVETRIAALGKQISEDYKGRSVHLVCILKGSVFFTCELAKRITVPVTMDFMSVSSYGDDTKSSGVVRLVKDLDEPLEGKDVKVDYTGFEIPDEFVVGYGLDYAQKYRNLPYIGVVSFEE